MLWLGAAYHLWTLVSPLADARIGGRGAVVLYVVVADVIWNLLLTDHSMGYTPANILLHVVVPTTALADWLLVGGVGRRAPYWFLDPDGVGVPAVVALGYALIAARRFVTSPRVDAA